jgi:DNA-binding NtrC family response regulator
VAANVLFRAGAQPADPVVPMSVVTQQNTPVSLDDRLRELESGLITWALKVSHGNKSKAAELLQIKRSTLGDRIARCGLDRQHAEPAEEPKAASSPLDLPAQ